MSLLAATWTTAIATALLAIGAVFTALYARNAYRDQSRQTGLLQGQAERDIRQRRRAQATHPGTVARVRSLLERAGDGRHVPKSAARATPALAAERAWRCNWTRPARMRSSRSPRCTPPTARLARRELEARGDITRVPVSQCRPRGAAS